jgi:hypothetical protein
VLSILIFFLVVPLFLTGSMSPAIWGFLSRMKKAVFRGFLYSLPLFFLITPELTAAGFSDGRYQIAGGLLERSSASRMFRNSTEMVDQAHERISIVVLASAKKIDAFFREENYQAEENTSSLRVRLDAVTTEGEGMDFSINPTLRLVLPYTEKRLHLEIMGSADRQLSAIYEKTPMVIKQFDQTRKESPSAVLRYYFSITDRESISMVAGTRSDDNILAFYLGPRYRTTFNYRFWTFEFTEWLRWTSDDGMESNTVFDTDLLLTKQYLLRMRLHGDWRNSDDEFLHGIRFILYRPFGSDRALAYEWNNLFSNRPNYHLEEVNFRIKYRQRFLRKWLFLELMPQLAFPKDRNFKSTLSYLFRVEIYFGPEAESSESILK